MPAPNAILLARRLIAVHAARLARRGGRRRASGSGGSLDIACLVRVGVQGVVVHGPDFRDVGVVSQAGEFDGFPEGVGCSCVCRELGTVGTVQYDGVRKG